MQKLIPSEEIDLPLPKLSPVKKLILQYRNCVPSTEDNLPVQAPDVRFDSWRRRMYSPLRLTWIVLLRFGVSARFYNV